jgi:hypothetical protein
MDTQRYRNITLAVWPMCLAIIILHLVLSNLILWDWQNIDIMVIDAAVGVFLSMLVIFLVKKAGEQNAIAAASELVPHSDRCFARVTLVHGTFARGAAWTKEGSALRDSLEEIFRGRIKFHNFEWSGYPSYFSRDQASAKLQIFLSHLLQLYPNDMHFIIGHSHGGNVVLYALRNSTLAERIHGVITLSTPFLSARQREFNTIGTAGLIASGITLFFVGLYYAYVGCDYLVLGGVIHKRLYCMNHAWIGIPIFLCVMGIAAGLIAYFEFGVEWFSASLLLPKLPSDKLFIIRAPSDEANLFLILLQAFETLLSFLSERRGFIDEMTIMMVSFVLKTFKDIRENRSIRKIAGVWTFFGFLIFLFFDSVGNIIKAISPNFYYQLNYTFGKDSLLYYVAMPTLFWPIYAVMLPLIIGLIAIPVLAATAGTVALASVVVISLFLMPEVGPFSGALIISVEPCPPGLYQVLQISGESGTRSFLWHSATYTHSDALSAIADWIKLKTEFQVAG